MKNLLKKLSCMVLIVGVVIGCCACSTNSSKAYTFKVDTGDQVKVELNTAMDMILPLIYHLLYQRIIKP